MLNFHYGKILLASSYLSKLSLAKGGKTSFDNHLFDQVVKVIDSAPASLIFLYLYRYTADSTEWSVFLPISQLVNDLVLSDEQLINGIRRLHVLKLLTVNLSVITEFIINTNWIYEK